MLYKCINNVIYHLTIQCGNESARTDSFLDIPLVIKPFGSDIAYKSVVSFHYAVLP